MAQISNQAELQAALNSLDPLIRVTADFSVSSQINIRYAVTIESLNPDTPATITKADSYFTYLFRIMEGGSFTLQNIILDGNRSMHPEEDSNNRSLILAAGGTLNLLNGSIIQNNVSYQEGGGVYLNSASDYSNTLFMTDNARITGCHSRTNGGGIMIASRNSNDAFSITNEAMIDNNTAANGGGFYLRSYAPEAGITLTLSDQVHIINNEASGSGGGIFFSGYREGGAPSSSLIVSLNALISNNKALHGGGLYFYGVNENDRLQILVSANITHNSALQNGGGCYLTAIGVPANVTIDQSSITNNTGGTGGGCYFLTDSGGVFQLLDSRIAENKASNEASGSGGGVWIKNQSQSQGVCILLSGTALTQNEASASGGGMALFGGPGTFSFQMENSSIIQNQSSDNGGGLFIGNDDPGNLTIHQSVISENNSGGSGGGMYYANTGISQSTGMTITETMISNNSAVREGGGLRISSGSGLLTTVITDSSVSSNIAQDNSGGGIWNGGNNAALALHGDTVISDNQTIAGNGGGIYFNSTFGKLNLYDDVKVINNHADGRFSDFGNHGGGICLVPGMLTLQDQSDISYNTAGKYGGGISASEESLIQIESGSIHANTSSSFGGGIWNHAGSTVIITGGSLSGNTAPFGSGIYNDSFLYLEGSREISNGVYIENRSAVVQLKNALTEASVIQLENSVYVIPNVSGTPIVVGEATSDYPVLSRTDAAAFRKPVDGFESWGIFLSEDNTRVLLAPLPYYTINFEGNEVCCPTACFIPEPIRVLSGQPVALPDKTPTRIGYCFCFWNTKPCGKGKAYLPGESISSLENDLTLYAIWKANPCCCPCHSL